MEKRVSKKALERAARQLYAKKHVGAEEPPEAITGLVIHEDTGVYVAYGSDGRELDRGVLGHLLEAAGL